MGDYVFIPTISEATPEELVAHGLLALNRGTGGNVYFGVLSGVVKINYYHNNGILLVWGSLSTSQVVYSAYMLNGTYTMEITNTNEFVSGNVHGRYGYFDANNVPGFAIDSFFRSRNEALSAMDDGRWIVPSIPVVYAPVRCSLSGDTMVSSGDTVTVTITPDSGYKVANPQQGQSISVYNEQGYIPFTFNNNQITFTVP